MKRAHPESTSFYMFKNPHFHTVKKYFFENKSDLAMRETWIVTFFCTSLIKIDSLKEYIKRFSEFAKVDLSLRYIAIDLCKIFEMSILLKMIFIRTVIESRYDNFAGVAKLLLFSIQEQLDALDPLIPSETESTQEFSSMPNDEETASPKKKQCCLLRTASNYGLFSLLKAAEESGEANQEKENPELKNSGKST